MVPRKNISGVYVLGILSSRLLCWCMGLKCLFEVMCSVKMLFLQTVHVENVESKFVFKIIVLYWHFASLGQSIDLNMVVGINLWCSVGCGIHYSGCGIALLVVGQCGLFVQILGVSGFGWSLWSRFFGLIYSS